MASTPTRVRAPGQRIEQVREAVAKPGKSVALPIQRDGNKIVVPVRID